MQFVLSFCRRCRLHTSPKVSHNYETKIFNLLILFHEIVFTNDKEVQPHLSSPFFGERHTETPGIGQGVCDVGQSKSPVASLSNYITTSEKSVPAWRSPCTP